MSLERFDLRKIKWKCRRGSKELDTILERFFSQKFHLLDYETQYYFVSLLDGEDSDLLMWLYNSGYCIVDKKMAKKQ